MMITAMFTPTSQCFIVIF